VKKDTMHKTCFHGVYGASFAGLKIGTNKKKLRILERKNTMGIAYQIRSK